MRLSCVLFACAIQKKLVSRAIRKYPPSDELASFKFVRTKSYVRSSMVAELYRFVRPVGSGVTHQLTTSQPISTPSESDPC